MKSEFVAIVLFFACTVTAFGADQPAENWVGTWAAAPTPCPVKAGRPSAGDSTYRNTVRVSVGGKVVRVKLTNEFGVTPLTVGAARIGMSAGEGAIAAGTDHPLTFGGRQAVTIPEGGFVVSDEVEMELPALSSVAVSVYVTDQVIAIRSCHLLGLSSNYVTKGDATAAATMKSARMTESWNFLKGIDVRAENNAFAIVALGDSITDGNASTKDANRRWPDYLAERLQKTPNGAQTAVLNEGIVGNRVLRTSEWGPGAIARFDRDVLAQSGARYLILLEGFNDINWADADEDASSDDLIFGLSQLVERAHARGMRVIGATLIPFGGADGATEKEEAVREAVNNWVRTGGMVDGVIDFDKVMRDPAKPAAMNPAYDSGDHVHPNDAGYEAMGKAIDLGLFQRTAAR